MNENGNGNGTHKANGTDGVFSPSGWKIEPMSRFVDDHKWAANRCRNIIAALENLLNQMGTGWTQSEFIQRLKAAKEVYESEMDWHLGELKSVIDARRRTRL